MLRVVETTNPFCLTLQFIYSNGIHCVCDGCEVARMRQHVTICTCIPCMRISYFVFVFEFKLFHRHHLFLYVFRVSGICRLRMWIPWIRYYYVLNWITLFSWNIARDWAYNHLNGKPALYCMYCIGFSTITTSMNTNRVIYKFYILDLLRDKWYIFCNIYFWIYFKYINIFFSVYFIILKEHF